MKSLCISLMTFALLVPSPRGERVRENELEIVARLSKDTVLLWEKGFIEISHKNEGKQSRYLPVLRGTVIIQAESDQNRRKCTWFRGAPENEGSDILLGPGEEYGITLPLGLSSNAECVGDYTITYE